MKETHGNKLTPSAEVKVSYFPLFGGNCATTRNRLKVGFMKVTTELLEQGLSRNGALNARQVNALGENITVSGWRWRLSGKEITGLQKKRFLELKDAHLPTIQPRFAGFE